MWIIFFPSVVLCLFLYSYHCFQFLLLYVYYDYLLIYAFFSSLVFVLVLYWFSLFVVLEALLFCYILSVIFPVDTEEDSPLKSFDDFLILLVVTEYIIVLSFRVTGTIETVVICYKFLFWISTSYLYFSLLLPIFSIWLLLLGIILEGWFHYQVLYLWIDEMWYIVLLYV